MRDKVPPLGEDVTDETGSGERCMQGEFPEKGAAIWLRSSPKIAGFAVLSAPLRFSQAMA
jgi:hypothetical protein